MPEPIAPKRRKDQLTVLFESAEAVAVAKPPGVVTVPGRGESQSMLQLIAGQAGLPCAGSADPRIRPVHRLDKDTSGVLLFVKDRATQRHVSQQFQNNVAGKQYLALVSGRPDQDEGEIVAPLAPDPSRPNAMLVSKRGKRAVTRWRIEESFRKYTLLRVFPETGKTHQIRVHMKSAGFPLVVDPLYHPPARGEEQGLYLSSFKPDYRDKHNRLERPLLARLSLHAERLSVDLPGSGQITIIAPLPKDFGAALNQLRRHGV
ncbi:MAG: RluA family pseudouridine synthase [Phycisphaerae bacterium]